MTDKQGMNVSLRTFTVFLWGCLIATAAVAGDKHQMKIKVAVDGDGEESKVFEWHGDGTTIDDLEVGESKTITDDDGNEITLTRTGKGLDIEVEGEHIEVMHPGGENEDVIIEKHKKVKVIKGGRDGGITIISSDAIDEETRARLAEVLAEAGQDGEIVFIDGSEMQGDEQAGTRREVRVIRKKTDVTN